MNKTLLTVGVSLAAVCGTLAYATTGRHRAQISQESIQLAKSRIAEPTAKSKAVKSKTSPQRNVNEAVADLWNTAPQIMPLNEGGAYDAASNTITFPGSADTSNQLFAGVDEEAGSSYYWYAVQGQTYRFSGTLTSNGAATVYPCIVYEESDQLYISAEAVLTLDETNGFTSTFELSTTGIYEGAPLLVAFLVEGSSPETTITATDIQFYNAYSYVNAQKWSAETDLPGLGLSNLDAENTYTVLCEDGITTLGLYYYEGNLSVTGINTTATEVTFPANIAINDTEIEQIYYFGDSYNGNTMDWSGAPALTSLNVAPAREICAGFENSPVTDLYIGQNCEISVGDNGFANIYLHIPYGVSRGNYTGYGFRRVLVGDEQPDYPEANYSDWVIAGENADEYFGISLYDDNIYRIAEIFTDKDSVALPVATPDQFGSYYIRGIGADSYSNRGALCQNATNLRAVTVPESYNSVNVSWSDNPITDLHMQGNVPETYWSLPSNMTVHVGNQSYFSNYENNSNWNSASIVPDGWEFEWMTINVGRKGEFAQTYIEMTDADWTLGTYVKVTGTLNETDLSNIKNLTNLTKLDLSEAEFTNLPDYFLSDKETLREVILPDYLTTIPQYAFSSCSKLSKVTAAGLTSIGDDAFRYCSCLSDLDLSNVESIGSWAFQYCGIFNPTDLSHLRSIGQAAFEYTGITEVFLPEGLSIIENWAFKGSQLTKVTLSSTITSINQEAFYGCTNLTEINLPEGLTSIGYEAFYGCTNLTEINLPEGLTSIGNEAFYGCQSLFEITLPSTLQTIEYGTFNHCYSLTTIKCKAIVPPVAEDEFTSGIDMNHCTLYVAPFAIDAYRAANNWSRFYIMKPLDEPVKNIYINRPMTFDLLSEDNAVLQENPNMILDYNYNYYYNNSTVGQLSASGDGTLSAGIFSIYHRFQRRTNSSDYRTTLVNNAENMRADSVMCSIDFEKNYWHFISFQYDVQMEDIFGLNNTDFVVRQYNSTNRASGDGTVSNWENVPADGVLTAGKGYIIQAANNSTDENGNTYAAIVRFPSRNTVTKNNLFTSNNIIVPLEEYPAEFAHNRSWNLVGNPYPCYYDMHYLMDDFTTPIVLWRGTNYQAYSPIDDDIILRPNEAFFVQRPLDAEQMVFGAEGRMHYNQASNAGSTPGIRVAAERSRSNSSRNVFNFTLEGCGSDDRARIVMNEEALMDYEINRDAAKFFAEVSEGAEIYVDGNVKYDICERPLAEGTATLGLRVGKAGRYTIGLSGRNIDGWTVMLTDTQTGTTVNLNEGAYSFDAEAGTAAGRFVIKFNAPDESAIDNINISTENESVRIVSTTGITVFEGNIDDFKASAPAGVYVVVGAEKAYKIVVK